MNAPDQTPLVQMPAMVAPESFLDADAAVSRLEALYAQDRNPITALMAVEGIKALQSALPVIAKAPQDGAARGQALP